MVMGDDRSTIKELIDDINSDPRRGEEHENVLTTIKVDNVTNSILVQKNLTLNSVLPLGEILFLKDTANISKRCYRCGASLQRFPGGAHCALNEPRYLRH